MSSYSQFGQDIHVLDYYSNKSNGFFIDVGAYDGKEISNTYLLEHQFNWKGICFEPLPNEFEKCKKNRPNSICINNAVFSQSDKEFSFAVHLGLSGIKEYINKHAHILDTCEYIKVKTVTLTEILDKYNAPLNIDYMSIDTEGSELEVLKGIDFDRYSFGVMHIEHNNEEPKRSDIRSFLENKGYHFDRQNEVDDYYIKTTQNLRHKEYTIWFDVYNVLEYGQHTGIGRVIQKVVSELLKIRDKINVNIELVTLKDKKIGLCTNWRCYKPLSNKLEMKRGDVLFLPNNVYNIDNLLEKVTDGLCVIPFLHDIIPITHPEFCGDSKDFKSWIIDITNLKTGIICNSRFTLESFLEKFHYNYPIGYVHLGCDKEDLQFKPIELPKGKNVLMVSTIEPRKMYDKTLEQFEVIWETRDDINLIIVGKKGWRVDELMKKFNTHPKRMTNLFHLTSVCDAELNFLYKNCDLFLFASEVEGFGLGLIEAGRFGTPLLLRDIPVFREIAGEHATYFDDFKKLPNTIIKGLNVGFNSSKGMNNNSWLDTALETLYLINEIRNSYTLCL